jgi:hypothetical protein
MGSILFDAAAVGTKHRSWFKGFHNHLQWLLITVVCRDFNFNEPNHVSASCKRLENERIERERIERRSLDERARFERKMNASIEEYEDKI